VGITEKKRAHRVEARQARLEKRFVESSSFMSYPAEDMENISHIVGLRNRGIKYNPELNAANTAQIWFNKRKLQGQTEAARNEILKYSVEEANLDNNPDTTDNVIVYSDKNFGKIYPVDGYQLKESESS
jgi:hypothetical protein